ncbi:MAG: NHLP bacteriocin system secretion protein [Rhodospirillaceae bacterium]
MPIPNFFREQALERLSSPDQLDQAMRVARPIGWLAIGLFLVVTIMAGTWATISTAPVIVRGQGILIEQGGVTDIVAASEGRVIDLAVDVGAYVEKGTLIARISLPEIEQRILSAKKALQELADQRTLILELQAQDRISRKSFADHQRINLQNSIAILSERLRAHEERLAGQQLLWDKRFIAKQLLVETHILVTGTKEQIAKVKADLESLDLEVKTRENNNKHELMTLDAQIGSTSRALADLEASLIENGNLKATASGTVAEMKVSPGDVVSRGTSLLSLISTRTRQSTGGLVAVVFIAAADGKKVKTGMTVQIAPSTVKREEYGSIIGIVRTVADIPATAEGLMRLLKNRQLVQELSQNGAPIKIEVELERANTPSGFNWSSSRGPDLTIDQGTLTGAFITVRRIRLITMMFPMLEPLLATRL